MTQLVPCPMCKLATMDASQTVCTGCWEATYGLRPGIVGMKVIAEWIEQRAERWPLMKGRERWYRRGERAS